MISPKDVAIIQEHKEKISEYLAGIMFEICPPNRVQKDEFSTIVNAARSDGMKDLVEAFINKLNE